MYVMIASRHNDGSVSFSQPLYNHVPYIQRWSQNDYLPQWHCRHDVLTTMKPPGSQDGPMHTSFSWLLNVGFYLIIFPSTFFKSEPILGINLETNCKVPEKCPHLHCDMQSVKLWLGWMILFHFHSSYAAARSHLSICFEFRLQNLHRSGSMG
jgi:hypothetical protein